MKLVSVYGDKKLGLIEDDTDLYSSPEKLRFTEKLPATLASVLSMSSIELKDIFSEVESGNQAVQGSYSGTVRISPPIADLSNKIICVGGNYPSHVANIRKISVQQATSDLEKAGISGFLKMANTIVGPYGDIGKPNRTEKFDYEVELAAVIGKRCKDVKRKDAENYIFGYTVFMDYSLRDIQEPAGSFNIPLKKNFDTSGSMGPSITLAEDISDPYDLNLKLLVNNEVRQDGSTKGMLHRFDELIEWYSRDFTLHPGDVISTGTCSGTALEREKMTGDSSYYLKSGDLVDAYVENIGHIRNFIM